MRARNARCWAPRRGARTQGSYTGGVLSQLDRRGIVAGATLAGATLAGATLVFVALALGGCTTSSPGTAATGSTQAAVASTGAPASIDASAASAEASSSAAAASDAVASPPASIDLTSLSTTDPASIWVVVNKQNPLNPKSWVPTDLTSVTIGGTSGTMRTVAAAALSKLAAASDAATGNTMTITSSYRSYATQVSTYNKWKRLKGKKQADLVSARPGYSEHQTGLAVDIDEAQTNCELSTCFATTATGAWVAKNAWKYGFIVRFPDGGTSVTGYSYEPWHLRYVGTALARYMHANGITTLETALGTGAADTY